MLVKTDRSGQVVKQIDVGDHHGNLCFHNGQVYVAVNFGKFNDAEGNADSWVFVYDAGDLALLAKHNTPEVIYGAGGIAYHDRRFVVVGGWPEKFKGNNAYEYDAEFKFVKLHRLKSLTTLMGIQTAAFADGHWWFGCYGDPKILLKEDESFSETGRRFEFDCSLRIVPIGGGKFLVARGTSSKEKGCTGKLVLAEADEQQGLRLIEPKQGSVCPGGVVVGHEGHQMGCCRIDNKKDGFGGSQGESLDRFPRTTPVPPTWPHRE